jgi:hypothetical protein
MDVAAGSEAGVGSDVAATLETAPPLALLPEPPPHAMSKAVDAYKTLIHRHRKFFE